MCSEQLDLFYLHPKNITTIDEETFTEKMKSIEKLYSIKNLTQEAGNWRLVCEQNPNENKEKEF